MTGPEPLCLNCRRFQGDNPEGFGFKCEAFSATIPFEIITWQADHRRPYKGDHGLRFKARSAGIGT